MTQVREQPQRNAGDGVVRTADQVRQAVMTRHVRWMLAISLSLAVVALGAAWLTDIVARP